MHPTELIQISRKPTDPSKVLYSASDDFWVLAESACYLGGRGVTFGPPLLGVPALNPGVYSIPITLQRLDRTAAIDKDLHIFADGSLDHILITPMIAASDNAEALLREASQKLKIGGHLVLLTYLEVHSPEQNAFYPPLTREILSRLGKWSVKADIQRNGKHLLILKRLVGKRGLEVPQPIVGKRVCIARYGALGDAIIMTPLLRKLREEGFHITLNISSYCSAVFENNPFVDNILIQERDLIPNQHLGRYWDYWKEKYDKYINLSESIEGDLLVVEGRAPFFTSKAWRHKRCNTNYYDHTMARAGYPESTGARGELYFTEAEERRARKFWDTLRENFVLVWAINGSSHHKVYPMMEATLREWFASHSDARCITTGDYVAKTLEFAHPQMIPRAGVWSLRESLIATKYAQCVVGPETMMTNASGCFDTPKIVLLSHSSKENLTKYFTADHSLEPDTASAPCYPCHQLHYTKESCVIGTLEDTTTGGILGTAPICSISIAPERVMAELDSIYSDWKVKHESHTAARGV